MDDFERTELGSDWAVTGGSVELNDGDLVLTASNHYAGVRYEKDADLGDGSVEMSWNPQTQPSGWKHLYVVFRDDPNVHYLDSHRVSFRYQTDNLDICFTHSGSERCTPYSWPAPRWFDLRLVHEEGTLDVYIDGSLAASWTYPEQEVATRLVVAVSDNGSGHRIEYVRFSPVTNLAPENLLGTRGPHLDEADLSWDSPSDLAPEDIQGYEIYRGLAGGATSLIATVNTTTFRDEGLHCGLAYDYEVAVVGPDGVGPRAGPLHLAPDPLLHALCLANDRPFYWGPLSYGNSEGASKTPPTSLGDIHQRSTIHGEYPIWFQSTPTRFTCCAVLSYDGNTLYPDASEFRASMRGALRQIYAGDFAEEMVDTLESLGKLEVASSGLQMTDAPFLDSNLQGQAAFTSGVHIDVNLDSSRFATPGATADARGKIYLDESTGTLQPSGLDTLWATTWFDGPNLSIEKGVKHRGEVSVWGLKLAAGIEGKLDLGVTTQINGALGGKVHTGSVRPALLAAGVGDEVAASGKLQGSAFAGAVRGAANAGAGFQTGFKAEALMPIGGGPASGETTASPYTGIRYTGITGPTFTLVATPAGVNIDPVTLELELGIFSANVVIPAPSFSWQGGAVTFGPAKAYAKGVTLVSAGGFAANAAGVSTADSGSEVASENETFEAHEQNLVLEVQGVPGTTGNVTLERPVGHYLPNGTYEVTPWQVTIPEIEIGPDGNALVHVDTFAVQRHIQDATRLLNLSFEAAVDAANAALDTNGDGNPDLADGRAPYNARAPTALDMTFSGPEDAPHAVHRGEPLRLEAAVRDLVDGDAVPIGNVTFSSGGVTLATAGLNATGVAVAPILLPASLGPGPVGITATYEGSAVHRVAEHQAVLTVTDRPPQPEILTPTPLQVLDLEDARDVTVRISAANATDVVGASAEVRLGNGSWVPAIEVRPGLFEATVSLDIPQDGKADGFHVLEARIADEAGHVGTTSTAFAVDTDAPHVQASGGPHVLAAGEALTVAWSADEPVLGKLTLRSLPTGSPVAYETQTFATTGELASEALEPGVYLVTLEFRDSALRAPEWAPGPTLLVVTV